MEQFTTWTITGVAAALTFAITNLGGLKVVVSEEHLKISLIAFVLSLLFGVVSKQLGQGAVAGLTSIERLEHLFSQPEILQRIAPATFSPEEFGERLASAFLWPFSSLIRWSNKRALMDPLRTDRTLAKLFSLQIVTNLIHVLVAIFGVAWIVFHT